jgi:hypothetical protein
MGKDVALEVDERGEVGRFGERRSAGTCVPLSPNANAVGESFKLLGKRFAEQFLLLEGGSVAIHRYSRRLCFPSVASMLPCLRCAQDGLCCRDAGERRPFHEPLPFIERVRVLTGKKQIACRDTFPAGHRRKLAGTVAGVAAFHQGIRRPMFAMDKVLSIACGRAERTRIYDIQIGQE